MIAFIGLIVSFVGLAAMVGYYHQRATTADDRHKAHTRKLEMRLDQQAVTIRLQRQALGKRNRYIWVLERRLEQATGKPVGTAQRAPWN